MKLSNYLNSLNFDLREALIAVSKVQELCDARERAYQRAQEQEQHTQQLLIFRQAKSKEAHESFREASIMLGKIKQRLGELEDERFMNDEEMQDWKDRH